MGVWLQLLLIVQFLGTESSISWFTLLVATRAFVALVLVWELVSVVAGGDLGHASNTARHCMW